MSGVVVKGSRASAVAFVALVFALSAPFWVVGATTGLMLPLGLPVAALAFVCPGVAAAILTYRREGGDGVRRLLGRVVDRGRAAPTWYVVAVVVPVALVLLERTLVLPILGLPVPPPHAPLAAIPVLAVVFFVSAAFEEAGWTAYAADPLQERFGALLAGLILGAVWAVWHLVPLLQASHPPEWIVWWFVGTVAVRVPILWVYNGGSSALAAVLFHCMLNVTGWNYGPTSSLATVGVMVVVLAAAVAFLWGPRTLARFRYARRRTARAVVAPPGDGVRHDRGMGIEEQWSAVDAHLVGELVAEDDALVAARRSTREHGMPSIEVTANQGAFLALLTQVAGARRVLELGTLAGYSTIWLARAVGPDGRVTTVELDAGYAEVARGNLERAGVADRVEIMVGPALDVVAGLAGAEPFDVVFIDADKANMPRYLELVLPLTRSGSVIVGDNVVRSGRVADASSGDPNVQGVRAFLHAMGADPRLDATALQTVGSKGWDGFAVARVR